MAYVIKKSNGQVLVTLQDGTLDTTSSPVTLIGKNYPGYGVATNDNVVRLLENFANSNPPSNPLTGQLWYDTSTAKLSVYNGNVFKPSSSITVSASTSPPTQNTVGDFWYAPDKNELLLYDGVSFIVIGPPSNQSLGTFKNLSVLENGEIGADLYVGGNITAGGSVTGTGYQFSPSIASNRVFFSAASALATSQNLLFDPATNTLSTLNLTVVGTINIGTGIMNNLRIGAGTAGSPSISEIVDTSTGFYFPSAGVISASILGAEKLRINQSGNVGIGTASPAQKLDVAGNIFLSAASPAIQLNTNGPILYTSGTNKLSIATSGAIGAPVENFRLTATGLALGSIDPVDELTLYKTTGPRIGLRGTTTSYVLREDDASGTFRLANATSGINDLITVTSTGNVGIGTTTNSTYALEVVGDINIVGDYYQNGVLFVGGGGGGTVTAVNVQSPLVTDANPTSPTLGLSTTGTPGTYGTSNANVINTISVDNWGRVTAVTTMPMTPAYTPTPPVLYNVTSGYTNGGRVIVKTTTPTVADLPSGTFQPGDMWLDTSGGSGYSQVAAQNGWTQLPNGILIQWGRVSTINTGESLQGPFTFTKPFSSAPWSVVATPTLINAQGGADVWMQVLTSSITSSQFSVYYQRATSPSYGLDGFTWMAIGPA